MTYVDLALFYTLRGLRHAFPKAMSHYESGYASVVGLGKRIAALPNVGAYLKSERCYPFSDGIFRYYSELDKV